jgi:hypothetical protein
MYIELGFRSYDMKMPEAQNVNTLIIDSDHVVTEDLFIDVLKRDYLNKAFKQSYGKEGEALTILNVIK